MQGEFYHELMRKYVVLFGTLFNNINITRYNADGTKAQQLKVPVSYGPREKFLSRISEDEGGDRTIAITLPRISFEISSVAYDGTRKLNTLNQVTDSVSVEGKNVKKRIWQPVPYNITFALSVLSRTTEDGAKIIEQILPNFTPNWNISAKLIDDLDDYIIDIPVNLTDIASEDLYTGDFISRRAVTWNLTFTMKALFMGPKRESKIIKIAKTNLYTDLNAESPYDRVTIQPGVTSANTPTTYSSNSVVQALGEAVVTANTISSINITTMGFGYANASITIDPPSDNTGITAHAIPIYENTRLVGAEVINSGSKYSEVPTVTISAPDMATIPYGEIEEHYDFGYVVTIENINQ